MVFIFLLPSKDSESVGNYILIRHLLLFADMRFSLSFVRHSSLFFFDGLRRTKKTKTREKLSYFVANKMP